MQVPVEIGLNLRPISATDLHSKSKEAGKHPWGLPALITAEQDRARLSMAAHEMRRSSRPLTALTGSAFNIYCFCSNRISESKIMFYEDHCRRKFPNQIFNLHSRIDVNIVKRFTHTDVLVHKGFLLSTLFSFVPLKNLPFSFQTVFVKNPFSVRLP